MIETLLGSVLGAGTRLAQSWFTLREKKAEAEHEFRMLDLNIKLDAQRAAAALAAASVVAASEENKAEVAALTAATAAQAKPSGVRWIDGLSASVRPVLAYTWCVVGYSIFKISAVSLAVSQGASWEAILTTGWTDTDQSVMASIIGFWLCDRSLLKTGRA